MISSSSSSSSPMQQTATPLIFSSSSSPERKKSRLGDNRSPLSRRGKKEKRVQKLTLLHFGFLSLSLPIQTPFRISHLPPPFLPPPLCDLPHPFLSPQYNEEETLCNNMLEHNEGGRRRPVASSPDFFWRGWLVVLSNSNPFTCVGIRRTSFRAEGKYVLNCSGDDRPMQDRLGKQSPLHTTFLSSPA